MTLLSQLIPANWYDEPLSEDVVLNDMTADSRCVGEGDLFIAVPGFTVDGRDSIESAIANGAVAVLYEVNDLHAAQISRLEQLGDDSGTIMLAISDLSDKVGFIAAAFFDHPSQTLRVMGVTGTNGKTSCAYLLAQSFQLLGFQTAFIGTIGWGGIGDLQPMTYTTPDAIHLQYLLAKLVNLGYTHVCMEVSSHALEQGRVNGMQFYGAMFTNLTHDHLDYHKTMANYAAAKQRLFTDFQLKFVVTNSDDEFGKTLVDYSHAEFIASYGREGDVYYADLVASPTGLMMTIESESLEFAVETQLIGLLNVPNILLVVTTLLVLGVDVADIQHVVKKLQPANGRMELFSKDKLPATIVDYAHTPDALQRALLSCREHCHGQLWVVFGCGGDRDQEKRPKMGAIAEEYADVVVLTTDNSRSESSQNIFLAIRQGMTTPVKQIEDRGAAIAWAIENASPDDWVLVAGKGHETTQTMGDSVIPFSDRQWVQQCLEVSA